LGISFAAARAERDKRALRRNMLTDIRGDTGNDLSFRELWGTPLTPILFRILVT
jgi:hypothetical protein